VTEADGPTVAGERPADAPSDNLVDRYAPTPAIPYLRMARIDRPIGWWLLLLPCWWSSALAAVAADQGPNLQHLVLFLVGAIAMRGAGSVWNDIVDRDLDGSVARTRHRPLPSGRITVRAATLFAGLLCLLGLAVLLQFNRFAIVLGFCSLLPVAFYPFMKRVSDHPQIVLGLAFAWGALMGWAAQAGTLGLAPLLLYAGTILWVVGYDTIYAIQDIEDDGIVGIRSTALAYGPRAPVLIAGCYLGAVALIGAAAMVAEAGWASWLGLAGFAGHLLWQARKVDLADGESALALFRSNRDAGLILSAGIIIDSLI